MAGEERECVKSETAPRCASENAMDAELTSTITLTGVDGEQLAMASEEVVMLPTELEAKDAQIAELQCPSGQLETQVVTQKRVIEEKDEKRGRVTKELLDGLMVFQGLLDQHPMGEEGVEWPQSDKSIRELCEEADNAPTMIVTTLNDADDEVGAGLKTSYYEESAIQDEIKPVRDEFLAKFRRIRQLEMELAEQCRLVASLRAELAEMRGEQRSGVLMTDALPTRVLIVPDWSGGLTKQSSPRSAEPEAKQEWVAPDVSTVSGFVATFLEEHGRREGGAALGDDRVAAATRSAYGASGSADEG
jgi:uncharacterized coiled-coil protein SlyX